jgi:cytidylate kinase
VLEVVPDFDYRIGTDPETYHVFVGDHDVTEAIREPEVTAVVSAIARIPEVRARLTELFRGIMRHIDLPGIVVEGRDITTVVAPDAPVRILLTASEEARIARRSAELVGHSAAHVGEQLHRRDLADSRVVDFMNAADGVTTVDSTELDFEQTVDAVVDVVHTETEKAPEPHG